MDQLSELPGCILLYNILNQPITYTKNNLCPIPEKFANFVTLYLTLLL